MGQIVFNGQKPKYCNLSAITTGSKKDYVIPSGEVWLIDSTNASKTDGTGKYDYYIIGDNSKTASQLAASKIRIDDNDEIIIDGTPTENSPHAVSSGGVYQAIQDIDVSGQISGKADKSEMSVVAGTGADADKTTITLKNGTSATVLTQHQDISGKQDTISDLSTIRSGAAAGAEAAVRPYNTQSPDGMGYLVLDKEATFASQVTSANTIYEIRYDYDLNAQTVTLPANCVLKFNGGSVKNGTLSGNLVTSTGKINAKELGCTYNDSTKGEANVNMLKILEGVTNAIHLQITDTLYLGDGYVNISDSIKIDGGGELRVNSFDGFNVIGDVDIENIKVYGSDIYTSGGVKSWFINVQAGLPNDVTIRYCYFTGNVRVLHSSKTTDAELTQYFNNITVEGNTFEDIACQPASVMFQLTDTNFRTLTFKGNKVHNFLGVFIACGITNDSAHDDNIANFMATKGRDYYVSDNYVFNDMDFMPWENVAFYTDGSGYFTFLLGELGECVFENNSISNIISNYSGFSTYDTYLSVTNLTYRNNKIKNCLNLTGENNQLLKSKGLQGVGKYLDNIYVIEDLASYFPNITINHAVRFKDMEGNNNAGILIVRGNTFDVHTWGQVDGYNFKFKKAYILDNVFRASYIGRNTSEVGVLGGVDADVIFENNVVEFDNFTPEYITNNKSAPAVMANTSNGNTFNISIKNNTLKNCIPIRFLYRFNVGTDFVGEIGNNVISYTLTRPKTNDVIIGGRISDKLYIHDNIFAQNTSNQVGLRLYDLLLANKCSLRFSVTTNTSLYLFNFSAPTLPRLYDTFGECFNVIFKTYDRTSGRGNVSEVKFTIENNDDTYTMSSIKAYDSSYALTQISSSSYILNHTGENYASAIYLYNLYLNPSQATVAITSPNMVVNADFDIDIEVLPKMKANKYIYHPTSGATARRPSVLDSSDVGFEFFDTTLGKTIFAKAVASDGTPTWVYADGTAV